MTFRRRMAFAGSWYPDTARACERQLRALGAGDAGQAAQGRLGVAPHAGWVFSGRFAARVFESLRPAGEVQLVVVLGGHLRTDDPLIAMTGGTWETPFGWFPIHRGFSGGLERFAGLVLEGEQRSSPDNSVEIHLPLARRKYPHAELLPIRVPPNGQALALGDALARYLDDSGLEYVVVASTDLTHYGPNFGFEPAGGGVQASRWMEDNDRAFIDAALSGDGETVLAEAKRHRNACSAGSVAAVCQIARARNEHFSVLDYGTSADTAPHDHTNMVGYLGGVFG